jgi:peptidoglycan/LPS O-acetylase OafA/YrhL
MAARLWTALLMLTAVFAMHGVQCTSAADGAGSATTTAHVATRAHTGPVAMTALTAGQTRTVPEAASFDDPTPAHAATATVAAVAALVDAGHSGAPHDWAAHLWTACLAVLAVALAVLLALLVPRLVQLGPPAPRSANTRAGRWVTPPLPVDLSALCLLRI